MRGKSQLSSILIKTAWQKPIIINIDEIDE